MDETTFLKDAHISFIGGGNMATAIITGLIAHHTSPEQILVIEPNAEKCALLQQTFNIATANDVDALNQAGQYQANVIVLAVKPQQLQNVCNALLPILAMPLHANTLVISIAAGISASTLSRWLNQHAWIVRVMPNTPAQIQAGVSALYALPNLSAAHQAIANAILSAVGKTLWLTDELKMDAVTAISGSGPAYVFYFIEALQAAAEALGLTASEASMLALHTFAGASQLALLSDADVVSLRAQVTSKGGTTEQGVAQLEAADIRRIMRHVTQAAAEKSAALGRDLIQ